jgi:hypothetical protein
MPSTYTENLGIEKPGTGEQVGTWGSTDNTNYDLFDEAITGSASVTLSATGSTGAPNDYTLTDGVTANARKPYLKFVDGGDLGGTAYVRLLANDVKKIGWFENALSGSRDLVVFQGNYSASNAYTLPPTQKALLRFDGGGVGAVVSELASGSSSWVLQNTAATAVLGKRYLANSHSGFALTMPATFTASAASLQAIEVANVDTNSDVTLTPASGDQFYMNSAGLGTNTTIALKPGESAIIIPKTANADWDVQIFLTRQSDGDLPIPVGNLVIGTSGKGIDFSANAGTAATGATTASELLSFYEEGTWTPNLWDISNSSSEGQTYEEQSGRFSRIGRIVFFEFRLRISSVGTLTTNQQAKIGPLPYQPSTSGAGAVSFSYLSGISISTDRVIGDANNSGSAIFLYRYTGSTLDNMLISDVATGDFYGSGFYSI